LRVDQYPRCAGIVGRTQRAVVFRIRLGIDRPGDLAFDN
jgi:hypothetical protein